VAASDERDPIEPEATRRAVPGGQGPAEPASRDADPARAVLAANRAYYDAFEAADIDAMSSLWEHGDRDRCTHPGWASLRGWGAIAGSYFALFGNGRSLQFILTDEHVEVEGDTAWVSVDENILGGEIGATASALNVFVRGPQGWRMVVHHASQVVDTEPL
jgi:ketosteroid isomerase-like protein